MPIKGRTDSHTEGNGIPSLARLYKGQARDDSRPKWTPPELPYFRLAWEPVFARHARLFEEMYGAEPKEINGVLMLGNTPEHAFGNWMEEWGAGQKLVTRCDGEHIHDQFDSSTQRTAHGVMAPCLSADRCGCKQIGRLRFLLPEFMRESGLTGSFSLVTHGWYDIMKIDAALKDVYALYGTLRGVPFTLYREPVELPVPYKDAKTGEMKRTTRTFHMALLRVQDGYVNGSLTLPVINDTPRLMDSSTGEIIDAPALPAGTTRPRSWTKDEATAWVTNMKAKYAPITTQALLDGLGVKSFGEWQGTFAEASDTIDQFMSVNNAATYTGEMPF